MFGKLAVQTYANASACVKTTDDDISSIKSISEIALFQHSENPFKEFEGYQWDAAKSGEVTASLFTFQLQLELHFSIELMC